MIGANGLAEPGIPCDFCLSPLPELRREAVWSRDHPDRIEFACAEHEYCLGWGDVPTGTFVPLSLDATPPPT